MKGIYGGVGRGGGALQCKRNTNIQYFCFVFGLEGLKPTCSIRCGMQSVCVCECVNNRIKKGNRNAARACAAALVTTSNKYFGQMTAGAAAAAAGAGRVTRSPLPSPFSAHSLYSVVVFVRTVRQTPLRDRRFYSIKPCDIFLYAPE